MFILYKLIEALPQILGALITLLVGFWFAGFLATKLSDTMRKRKLDPSLIPFIKSLVLIGIKVLVLLSAASMFGFEVTSFIAILGALAFAVGLALQGNLSNFAAGMMILFFKPFRVGDFIVTNGYSGTVKEIQIFNTLLTTLDNRIIFIPNGSITNAPLENITANPMRKVPMTFGVSYKADIDKTKQAILKVARECDKIDHTQPIDLFVSELAESSVNLSVRPWAKTEDYWAVFFYMQEHIKKEFDKQEIEIPYPQMDVHLNTPNA